MASVHLNGKMVQAGVLTTFPLIQDQTTLSLQTLTAHQQPMTLQAITHNTFQSTSHLEIGQLQITAATHRAGMSVRRKVNAHWVTLHARTTRRAYSMQALATTAVVTVRLVQPASIARDS